MKVAGIVLTVLGGMMVVSGVKVALTEYDLTSSHDLSKSLGAMGISALILLSGIALIIKANSTRPK